MMAIEPQSPIDDALLSKFLSGEASATEADQVRRWLTDPTNQREFTRFERLWNAAGAINRPDMVNTEAAWQRVRTQMHRPTQSTTETIVRPVFGSPKRSNWFVYGRIAAVLALAVLTGMSVWQLTRPCESQQVVRFQYRTTTTGTQRLTLPDGSRVLLNRNSRLTYPAHFADSSRDVVLTGEAFFEVVPNPTHPFQVRAGHTVVRVLGTSFNVRAVGDSVRVAVRTGRVQLSAPRQAVVLTPNQQATYFAPADTIRRTMRLDMNRLAYQTGRLSFANASLAEVVQTLREVYNIDIRLNNPALGQCRLTADFGDEPVNAVLAVVAETLSLSVRRDGDARVRVLTGTGCGL